MIKTCNKIKNLLNESYGWIYILVFFVFVYFLSFIPVPNSFQIIEISKDTVFNLIEERLNNVSIIISIFLVVIGFLTSGYSGKNTTIYQIVFLKSNVFLTLNFNLVFIGCLLSISTFKESFSLDLVRDMLITSTYLFYVALFIIGHVFYKIIKINEEKILEYIHGYFESETQSNNLKLLEFEKSNWERGGIKEVTYIPFDDNHDKFYNERYKNVFFEKMFEYTRQNDLVLLKKCVGSLGKVIKTSIQELSNNSDYLNSCLNNTHNLLLKNIEISIRSENYESFNLINNLINDVLIFSYHENSKVFYDNYFVNLYVKKYYININTPSISTNFDITTKRRNVMSLFSVLYYLDKTNHEDDYFNYCINKLYNSISYLIFNTIKHNDISLFRMVFDKFKYKEFKEDEEYRIYQNLFLGTFSWLIHLYFNKNKEETLLKNYIDTLLKNTRSNFITPESLITFYKELNDFESDYLYWDSFDLKDRFEGDSWTSDHYSSWIRRGLVYYSISDGFLMCPLRVYLQNNLDTDFENNLERTKEYLKNNDFNILNKPTNELIDSINFILEKN